MMLPPPPEEIDYFGDFSDGFDSDYENESGYCERTFENQPRQIEDSIVSAIKNGLLSELQQLLGEDTGIGADSTLDSGWTPLLYAASESQPDIVKYLLDNGANPNKNYVALTPLMCACSSMSIHEICNAACVKLLLEKGALVKVVDRFGQTPLIRAAERGRKMVVSMLIPETNLEVRDSQGRTALFYAVQHDQSDVLQLLIDAGASTNVTDKHRYTVKDVALSKNHQPTLNILKDVLATPPIDANQMEYLTCAGSEYWKEMFPNIIPCEKSAYWNCIPKLLHGMYCENLITMFKKRNISLSKFLSLTEEELMNMNEVMPYQRKRLIAGLTGFHTHPWKMETVLGINAKNEKFEFAQSLEYFASHLMQLTVIDSTFQYMYNIIKSKKYKGELCELDIDYLSVFNLLRNELTKFGKIASEINKHNPPIADFIKPEKPKNIITRNKKKITFIFISLFCTFTFVKLRNQA